MCVSKCKSQSRSMLRSILLIPTIIFCGLMALIGCTGNNDYEDAEPSLTPLLWHITAPNGQTAYLFGSIHSANESIYPLPDYVMDAFYRSDYLVLEIDVHNNPEDFMFYRIWVQEQRRLYGGAGSIVDDLGEEFVTRAARALLDMRDYTPLALFHNANLTGNSTSYEWWRVLSGTAALYLSSRANLWGRYGVDNHFAFAAMERGMEIIQLECFREREELFASWPTWMIIHDLERMMDYIEADNFLTYDNSFSWRSITYEELFNMWKTGDEQAIARANAPPSEFGADDLTDEQIEIREWGHNIHIQRARIMKEGITNILAAEKQAFIVMGVGHIAGENSISQWLREEGYEVVRVQE